MKRTRDTVRLDCLVLKPGYEQLRGRRETPRTPELYLMADIRRQLRTGLTPVYKLGPTSRVRP